MTKEKVNAIALSLTIVGSISMLLIIALVVMAVYGSGNLIIQQTVPMYCVSFVAPYIVRHRKEFEYNKEIWLTTSFMLVGLILLWEDSLWIKNDMGRIICHYCVVGLAEEYVYRGCIMDILSKEFGKKITILISAVIFAFVGHLDSNFVDNLTFRLLLGIVLGMFNRLAKFFYWISIKYEVIFFCCTYIAIIIFSAILLLMVLRFKIESDIEISEKEYFWLSLTPTITVLVIQLNLIGNSGGDLAITLGFFVNNLAMIELYNFMNEKSYIMQLRSLQRSEESFYEDFIHRTKDIALVQHDLKNIMLGMGNQSNAKDIERGLLNGEMPSLIRASQNFSGNLIIDSILSRKCLEMDEKQIGYSVTSQVPCDLNLKDCEFDIWSILGNVLDNAIEACEGIGKSKRKIKMTFKFFRGRIIFKVENSCKEGTANYNADKVVSGKEEGRYGLGLKSIKEKVVKKGGFFDFRCKGEQFHSLIVYPVHLNNEENV